MVVGRPGTMAAVRCAARRLGGSLLQRAQAEERRRLVPSRLMRSRHLSTEQAKEIQQKKEAFYDAVSNAELKKKEFNDALAKAGDPTGQKHLSAPPTGYERVKMYGRRALGVIELTARTAIFMMLAVSFVRLSVKKGGESTPGPGETTTEVKAAN